MLEEANSRLIKLNEELVTKMRITNATTPRKAFAELGNRQIRRRSQESERLVNVRSPSLLNERNKVPRSLSSTEDISISLEVGLTGKQREKLKTELKQKNFDPFAPTTLVKAVKKKEGSIAIFEQKENGLYCKNVLEVLTKRIKRLHESGMLRISNGSVYVVLAGDKGGDKLANTSKFGFFISANVKFLQKQFLQKLLFHSNFIVFFKFCFAQSLLNLVLQQIDSIYEVSLGNGQIFKIKW
uniref:Uncharacterized protein n=1 Tax=Meloidogyne hapla TaxID=6305 RepID=A0A1I8BB90_MELHA